MARGLWASGQGARAFEFEGLGVFISSPRVEEGRCEGSGSEGATRQTLTINKFPVSFSINHDPSPINIHD